MARSSNHHRLVVGHSLRQQSAGKAMMGKINDHIALCQGGIQLLTLVMRGSHTRFRILRDRLLDGLPHAA